MKDPYEVLGVDRNISQDELKRKYRKLAKEYHPDLNPGDEEKAEKFKEIGLSYEILSDPEKRKAYDRYGEAAFTGGPSGPSGFSDFADFSDIFGSFFGDIFGGHTSQRTNRPIRGADIQQALNLTFKEACFGVSKEVQVRREVVCETCGGTGAKDKTKIHTCEKCKGTGRINTISQTPFGTISRQTTCDVCGGSGQIIEEECEVCHGQGRVYKSETIKVDIPAGVESQNVIRVSGKGHAGENGGANGDLYIIINVEEHEIFKRDGLDIYYEMPITFATAALGGNIQIPTLTSTQEYHIPEGTQTGTKFKLKNEGIKNERTGKQGDLYFYVKLITPKNLSKVQKEKLKEFAAVSGQEIKQEKNFFEKLKDLFD
ncbi:MAG: molecular chaperone DnaJ [Peptoniphilaceae bacterium]|nr:molecular chaperone DnaJ [Peptoniphilaceae bacterium]MDY6019359.1 molecular chaperone DnaJ [Anaerococcus sp.]